MKEEETPKAGTLEDLAGMIRARLAGLDGKAEGLEGHALNEAAAAYGMAREILGWIR